MLVEAFALDAQHLQVVAALVGRAAENEGAFVLVGEIGFNRVEAHVGRERHAVGLVALECLACIVFGRRADVAALGVENDGNAGVIRVNVGNHVLEFVFSAAGGKVGNLRLECADGMRRGVDDARAEVVNRARLALDGRRKARRIRVEADAKERIGAFPARTKHLGKGHDVLFCVCEDCQMGHIASGDILPNALNAEPSVRKIRSGSNRRAATAGRRWMAAAAGSRSPAAKRFMDRHKSKN